ncbi:hypothetical protein B481_2029 [Planococcus halocryophilus Or1]|uniref:Uncharacterized protein n=1 Tax=Planococcus halocryophilus TaxID=1215089 RepID=A0A1C7DQ14_9BACL|nr:hypothetical protein [Planococcus halocryophilus]ANU13492.1 hypothetical protein BBI08_06400 [Planococcus halocryophilus]EMF46302.1 hypothetical protein B481_2029 [Planococcus halocryophilus Or1]
MAPTGKASDDLRAFDKSEKMMKIRNIMRVSANEGNLSTVISFENLGTNREAIFIVTLLRQHGYNVEYGDDVIIVK